MALKIKGFDQVTAWIAGIVLAGTIAGVTYYVGNIASQREQKAKEETTREAESILAEATKLKDKEKEKEQYKAHPTKSEGELSKDDHQSSAKAPIDQTFGYSGTLAPWRWSDLQSDWKLCGDGKRQSPIDISGAKLNAKLKALKFNYQHGVTTLTFAHQTLQGDVELGSWLDIDGDRYDLKNISFHTPSEHRINGLPYEMEIQLHHQELSGRVAIVSILVTTGKSHETVHRLVKKLPRYEGESAQLDRFIWTDVLPLKKRMYWQYIGSMTTPPCSEGVKWIILTETPTAATKDIDLLAKLQKNNARPVQTLHGRSVHRSNR